MKWILRKVGWLAARVGLALAAMWSAVTMKSPVCPVCGNKHPIDIGYGDWRCTDCGFKINTP